MDSWHFFEPVDILTKIPQTFYEEVESKKWQERKSALETLLKLITDNPRLDDKANYSDIVKKLIAILEKDANINVAALSAKCITGLCSGVRLKFGIYSKSFAPRIFEKFKEKKPVLRDPLIECIDAVYSISVIFINIF